MANDLLRFPYKVACAHEKCVNTLFQSSEEKDNNVPRVSPLSGRREDPGNEVEDKKARELTLVFFKRTLSSIF